MSAGLNALNEGITALHNEGAGAVKLTTVMPGEAAGLFLNAMSGDGESATLLRCLLQAQQAIETAPRRRPMLCVACPAQLHGTRHAFVVVTPAVPEPKHGLAFAVCRRCATSPEAVGAIGVKAAKRFWPDLRALPPIAAGGAA